MPKNFDDILKAGKEKVSGLSNTTHEWKKKIKILLEALHDLNDLYDDNTENHLTVETRTCGVCEKICYVVVAANIDDMTQKIKFYRFSRIKSKDKNKYLCDKCK